MNNPIHQLITWLAPYDCIACSVSGQLVCNWCRSDMPHVKSTCHVCGVPSAHNQTCPACQKHTSLAAIYRRTYYEQPTTKQFIWRLKFDRAQTAASEMAEMIAPLLRALPQDTFITYVPTVPTRIRQRGYDQAERIAKRLARLTGLPFQATLQRVSKGEQIGAGKKLRHVQANQSFIVKHPDDTAAKRFIIIDDVMTTGATLEAAAQTLRSAGADDVRAAVFAYTPPRASHPEPKLL